MSKDTHCANEDLHKRSKRQSDRDSSYGDDGERDASEEPDGDRDASREGGKPEVGDELEVVSNEESDGVSNKICQMAQIVQTKTF